MRHFGPIWAQLWSQTNPEESLTIVFAVFDVDRGGNRGTFVGTWALYKVSRAEGREPGVITALVAPMLPAASMATGKTKP